MAEVRTARVVYQVHSTRIRVLPQQEIRDAIARHPIPLGHLETRLLTREDHPQQVRALMPRIQDFVPALPFDHFATVHQARTLYRVEAAEAEPESLRYLRNALLVAAEIAALTDGVIVDVLAWKTLTAADVADRLDRGFDPLDHIAVHAESGHHPMWVHTHGMEKFGHPDFEVHGVPQESVHVAVQLLQHLTAAVVAGGSFRPGEETQLCGFAFGFGPSGSSTADHFSKGSVMLNDFRLVSTDLSPDRRGLLAASDRPSGR